MPGNGSQSRGVNLSADPKSKLEQEQSADSIVLRNFNGVNLQSPRESIADDQFAWLEEMIPIGPGNMRPTLGPGAPLVTIFGENGPPTFTIQFPANGVDLALAIWADSGNAWVGQVAPAAVWTKIATGVFTSGQTAAAQWSNVGVLIVDPLAGYYDYIAVTSVNPSQLATGTVPMLRVSDPHGTGATIGASASVSSVVAATTGTGYSAGDVLQAVGGTLTTSTAAPASQQNQPMLLTVTSVNASTGAITGISLTNTGFYQVAPTNPVSVAGGTGSGATFTVAWSVGSPYVITPGSGYTAPVVQAFIGGAWVNYSMSIFTSGTLLGTAIAVYAGRVWIAIDRTVQFTDAGAYNSFGGSGSAFTINDSYLHNSITALYAANNYLYIFGDDSIDVLSNVTVVNGLAQFSRINVSSSIGTSQPRSVFPFVRSLAFSNNSGFYVVSGATPQKVSDDLDDLVAATDFGTPIWGAQVMVNNILCAAFLVRFSDSFTMSPPEERNMLVVLFRGRWWFTSQLPLSGVGLNSVFSYPVNGLSTMFGWAGNSLYPLMSTLNVNRWLLKTKLWDYEAPMLDKNALMGAIGVTLSGAALTGLDVKIDTEYTQIDTTIGTPLPIVQWINNAAVITQWQNDANAIVQWQLSPNGYILLTGSTNNGGGKYLGYTVTGNSDTSRIHLLALEGQRRRRY